MKRRECFISKQSVSFLFKKIQRYFYIYLREQLLLPTIHGFFRVTFFDSVGVMLGLFFVLSKTFNRPRFLNNHLHSHLSSSYGVMFFYRIANSHFN